MENRHSYVRQRMWDLMWERILGKRKKSLQEVRKADIMKLTEKNDGPKKV